MSAGWVAALTGVVGLLTGVVAGIVWSDRSASRQLHAFAKTVLTDLGFDLGAEPGKHRRQPWPDRTRVPFTVKRPAGVRVISEERNDDGKGNADER